MACACAILYIDRQKLLVRCINCKTNPINFESKLNNQLQPIKYKCFEYLIVYYRNNPEIRIWTQLFCLFGYQILMILGYFEHIGIIKISEIKLLNMFVGMLLTIWLVISITWCWILQELNKNFKFQLELAELID